MTLCTYNASKIDANPLTDLHHRPRHGSSGRHAGEEGSEHVGDTLDGELAQSLPRQRRFKTNPHLTEQFLVAVDLVIKLCGKDLGHGERDAIADDGDDQGLDVDQLEDGRVRHRWLWKPGKILR